MNARIFGLIGVVAALVGAASACKSDPTATGAGTAVQVLTDFSTLNIDSIGGNGTFTAWVVDSHLTPLVQAVSFSLCSGGGAVASVAADGTFKPVPAGTRFRAVVTGLGSGSTCVLATSAGLNPDTVAVVVP